MAKHYNSIFNGPYLIWNLYRRCHQAMARLRWKTLTPTSTKQKFKTLTLTSTKQKLNFVNNNILKKIKYLYWKVNWLLCFFCLNIFGLNSNMPPEKMIYAFKPCSNRMDRLYNMFYMGREQKLMLCSAYWELHVKNYRLYCQTPNLQFMILICYSSRASNELHLQWFPYMRHFW